MGWADERKDEQSKLPVRLGFMYMPHVLFPINSGRLAQRAF